MRKLFLTLSAMCFAAIAFVACGDIEITDDAVMVILKMDDGEYWAQVASAINQECNAKGVKAIIKYTQNDADSLSQLAAIDEMEKLDYKYNYRGIIAVPIYSENNHRVEARIAEVSAKYSIPVIIMDTPVDSVDSPLAGKYRTYVGTDNYAAGAALGDSVKSDSIAAENILAVRSKASNASVLRNSGFISVMDSTDIWETTEAESVNLANELSKHTGITCIVCMNGSLSCNSTVLDSLEALKIDVYTFDVFQSNLQNLTEGGAVKGILAQNTFEMGKQAVDAVFNANVKNPFYIAPIYISSNTDQATVKPFIDFYKNRGSL